MTDHPLCVLPHTEQNERQQEPQSLICRWHQRRIGFNLVEISRDWLDLALIIVSGTAPKDRAPKTRRLKAESPPAPANLDVLALRDSRSSPVRFPADQSNPIPSVPSIVASWVLLVAEERPITGQLPNSVIGQIDLLDRCGLDPDNDEAVEIVAESSS